MPVRTVNLVALGHESVVDVSYATSRTLSAFCGLSMIDSTVDFDRDNAVAIDIAYRNFSSSVRSPWLSGGDHWGSSGAFSNMHLCAQTFFGNHVRFRIRSFHHEDINCAGFGVVID